MTPRGGALKTPNIARFIIMGGGNTGGGLHHGIAEGPDDAQDYKKQNR